MIKTTAGEGDEATIIGTHPGMETNQVAVETLKISNLVDTVNRAATTREQDRGRASISKEIQRIGGTHAISVAS